MTSKADYAAALADLGVRAPASVTHHPDGRREDHASKADVAELRRTTVEVMRNLGRLPRSYLEQVDAIYETWQERADEIVEDFKAADTDSEEGLAAALEAREAADTANDEALHSAIAELDPLGREG